MRKEAAAGCVSVDTSVSFVRVSWTKYALSSNN